MPKVQKNEAIKTKERKQNGGDKTLKVFGENGDAFAGGVPFSRSDNQESPLEPKPQRAQAKRRIIYETIDCQLLDAENPLTAKRAMELLGWQEESENRKFGQDFLFKDRHGRRIRCLNNVTNRPFRRPFAAILAQEILRNKWQLNLEPIIIGRTGLVLNGQHRLVALILAAQDWYKRRSKWRPFWESEPTIQVLLALGADESDAVVNTMDTCISRTLADVLFRSEVLSHLPSQKRKKIARFFDYAVRLFWARTGAGEATSPIRRTHAESLDFVYRHKRLLDCVEFIHAVNIGRSISRYIGPGYAAALLCLMGCAATEPIDYYRHNPPTEESLDWSLLVRAQNFWAEFSRSTKALYPVIRALGAIAEAGVAAMDERYAIIAKAWLNYSQNLPITPESLELQFSVDEFDVRSLKEHPSVGGIDLAKGDTIDSAAFEPLPDLPRLQTRKSRRGVPQKGERASPDKWSVGDVAWVHQRGVEPYFAKLIEEPFLDTGGHCRVMVKASDGEWDVSVSDLSMTRDDPPIRTTP
jgi:hypothetical protein